MPLRHARFDAGGNRARFLHCQAPVPVELLAERFVRDGRGDWLDLATGDVVEVLFEPWTGRNRDEVSARIVDCGRVGIDRWFEARSRTDLKIAVDVALEREMRAAASRIASLAEQQGIGLRI